MQENHPTPGARGEVPWIHLDILRAQHVDELIETALCVVHLASAHPGGQQACFMCGRLHLPTTITNGHRPRNFITKVPHHKGRQGTTIGLEGEQKSGTKTNKRHSQLQLICLLRLKPDAWCLDALCCGDERGRSETTAKQGRGRPFAKWLETILKSQSNSLLTNMLKSFTSRVGVLYALPEPLQAHLMSTPPRRWWYLAISDISFIDFISTHWRRRQPRQSAGLLHPCQVKSANLLLLLTIAVGMMLLPNHTGLDAFDLLCNSGLQAETSIPARPQPKGER